MGLSVPYSRQLKETMCAKVWNTRFEAQSDNIGEPKWDDKKPQA